MKDSKNLIYKNKIVISFTILFLILSVATWQVVNSKKFANILSKRVTAIFKKEIKGNFKFEKLKLQMFPPGVVVSNLKVESEYEFVKSFTVSELEIQFNVFDLTSDKVSINEIGLSNVSLVTTPKFIENLLKSDNKTSKKNDLDFKKINKLIQESIPFKVKEVNANSFLVSDGSTIVEIKNLELILGSGRIFVDIEFGTLPIPKNEYVFLENIDKLRFKANWNQKQLKIYDLQVKKSNDKVEFRGDLNGNVVNPDELTVDGKVTASIDLNILKKIPIVNDVVKIENGTLELKSTISEKLFNFNANGSLKISAFKGDICHFDIAEIGFSKNQNDIIFQNGYIKESDQIVKLTRPFKFFDINKKYILPDEVSFYVENYFSNNFLYVLKPDLDLFKAKANGHFYLRRDKEGIVFSWKDDVSMSDFKIEPKNKTIVSAKHVALVNGFVKVTIPELTVKIESQIISPALTGKLIANVNHEGVEFNLTAEKVDLEAFGKIADLEFKGNGSGLVTIKSDDLDTEFLFDLDLAKGEFIDFRLGEVKTKFKLSLNDEKFDFYEYSGKIGQTKYTMVGDINFKNRVKLNLDVKWTEGFYADIKDALFPISKKLDFLPAEVDGVFASETKIFGMGDKIQDLKVTTDLRGENVKCYDERFSSVATKISFLDNEVKFDDVKLKKNNSSITGSFIFNTISRYLEYDAKVIGLNLADIDFYNDKEINLIGVIQGESFGNGVIDSISSKTVMHVNNSYISGQKMGDSIFELIYDEGVYYSNFNFFDNMVDGKINFNTKQKSSDLSKLSSANIKVNIDNFPQIAGLLSSHNTLDSFLSGKVNLVFSTRFNYNNFNNLDSNFIINNFSFERKNLKLKINEDFKEVIVENGEVRKWNILIEGVSGNLSSVGKGKVGEDLNVHGAVELDTNLLELINQDILNSSGSFKGNYHYKYSKDVKNNFLLSSEVNDFNFAFNGLPGIVEKAKFNINYVGGKFYIQSLHGLFAQGLLEGNGTVELVFPYPILDLNYSVQDSKINILKKTSVIASGKGKLTGDKFPYKVSGNFNVSSGLILDEPQDMGSGKKEDYTFNKYLPKKEFRNKIQLLVLDLNTVTTGPIKASNSLSQMNFTGAIRIAGDPRNLHFGGRLELVPGSGRFIFKNNDFILSKGSVTFFENEDSVNPELNFLGSSKINDYDISIALKGRGKSFEIDLTSKPNLSKDDILSLIALGVTGDVSRKLNDTDRQSMTNIGIGTLIFDKFKVNENLRSSLGLSLSLASEFQEENVNLVKSKNATDSSSNSRYKSGTKVKIQKNINSKTDLSVSSTVTGSIGQKQEMNLNYNFNKNVSAQGVYEINNDERKINDGESAGMDLKFKWTFK